MGICELTGPLQGKKTPGQDTAWISTSAFSLSTDNQIILSTLKQVFFWSSTRGKNETRGAQLKTVSLKGVLE
jgi:hypothetical protein